MSLFAATHVEKGSDRLASASRMEDDHLVAASRMEEGCDRLVAANRMDIARQRMDTPIPASSSGRADQSLRTKLSVEMPAPRPKRPYSATSRSAGMEPTSIDSDAVKKGALPFQSRTPT